MLVFTNGCFDLLTYGHVQFLRRCRQMGTRLIVGVNSDESIRKLKGSSRPIIPLGDRIGILQSCRYVDEVISFDRPTACELIEQLRPDIFVKGRGNTVESIPESACVRMYGGRIYVLDGPDIYTTQIIERILASAKEKDAIE